MDETHWLLILLVLALIWATRALPDPVLKFVRRRTTRSKHD